MDRKKIALWVAAFIYLVCFVVGIVLCTIQFRRGFEATTTMDWVLATLPFYVVPVGLLVSVAFVKGVQFLLLLILGGKGVKGERETKRKGETGKE